MLDPMFFLTQHQLTFFRDFQPATPLINSIRPYAPRFPKRHHSPIRCAREDEKRHTTERKKQKLRNKPRKLLKTHKTNRKNPSQLTAPVKAA
jgi:hypothetical protein